MHTVAARHFGGHTAVTMSVRKKAKCEETITVSHSTMESRQCTDEANNRNHVLVGEHKPLISYQVPHNVSYKRQPDHQ